MSARPPHRARSRGVSPAVRPPARALLATLLAVSLGALAGCATLTAPGPGSRPAPSSEPAPGSPGSERPGEPSVQSPRPPPRPQSDARAASDTLLEQSRAERAVGNNTQAAASIQRALRIDPNNAALWVELGEINLAAGNRSQAASMARKALTLTAGDTELQSRAERLLRAAGSG